MMLSDDEIRAMRQTSIREGARVFWTLAEEIATEYGIKTADLVAHGRGRLDVNEARQWLCFHAIKRGLSSAQIGKWLGGRDHSTVLHAAKKAQEKLAVTGENP